MNESKDPITWDRLRAIFGNPKPVLNVTERQFDYEDATLQHLGRTPYEEIDPSDFWAYYHDLAYVELQPELFNYLFPVCLMDWHRTLLADQPCSHGDAEFHYGVDRGRVFDKMLTPAQREQVSAFFAESFLHRIDCQREFPITVTMDRGLGWLSRFNSMGKIMPSLEHVWNGWWRAATSGRAAMILAYCSCLIYEHGERNPAFCLPDIAYERSTLIPLWIDDSFVHRGWATNNVSFLRGVLTRDYLEHAIARAVTSLKDLPEHALALQIQVDFQTHRNIVDSRLEELPDFLRDGNAIEWTV